jgi:hypothetical protein
MTRRKLNTAAGIALATLLCASYVLGQGVEQMRFDPARLEADYGMKIETKEKAVTVKLGGTLYAVVTDPGKLAAAGLSGTQKGYKLKLTWEGKTTWSVGPGPGDNRLKASNRMIVICPTLD